MPAAPTGASLLVECLHRHGADRVFGMPGSHSTDIFDAIQRHGDIRTTLCRNEQAGAFMADGYARVTGRPGVVCTTAGPGATHALTGIAEAFSDSVPVLLVAGQVNHDRIHEACGRYHEMDLESIFRPCARLSATVMDNAAIPDTVDRAFTAMLGSRPGPAALFLPQDLMAQPCDVAARARIVERPTQSVSTDEVRRARAIIAHSQRPIVLVGGGAVSSGAGAAIEALAEQLDCPIATTLNGKGIVDERRERALGHGRTRRARLALSRADLLIAVGCRFTEVFTASSSTPIPKTIIQIDIDSREIGINYPVALGLVGDARTVLETILADAAPARQTSWREAWMRTRGAEQLKPEWLIDTLRAELPEDGIVFADACEMGLRMQTDFPVYTDRSFFYPSNFASLGWGFPAAIGGAVARPDRWVACVAGDGGFMMAPQELATLSRYRLKLIVIVHNDSAYGAIKSIQRARHDARYVETELNNPDLVALAQSFGVPSCRARDRGELAAALRDALRRDGPSFVEVPETWRSLRI